LLCSTVDEVIDSSEVIVVGNRSPEFIDALARCRADQIVVDLVRLPIAGTLLTADYRGICW
jgi:GDP-mannose 6-dehydrogenase